LTKSQKPKAKSQKPKAKSQKPKAKSQKPKAKSIIIHFGAYSSSLFYIVSGSVAAIGEDSDDKEITLAYLNAGDFVGENGLI
jgi:CRP-like cAMP-binding protein